MSLFKPSKPGAPAETSNRPEGAPPDPMSGGVKVIVHDPAPEPDPVPEMPEPSPQVVISPPPEAELEREALFESLCKQHGDFLREMLRPRKDVLDESKKDLQQQVLLVLHAHIEEEKSSPKDVRGFLLGVLRNEIRNHKRRWRPLVDPGADAARAASPGPDPEQAVEDTEQRAKLDRYLSCLSDEEADAVRHVILQAMTLDAAARALGRRTGTVATQLARAREKLGELARESDRQTALGARRRNR